MINSILKFYNKIQKRPLSDPRAIPADRLKFYEYFVMRPLSVPITYLMYKLKLSANLASTIGGLLLLLSSLSLFFSYDTFLAIVFYNLYFIFDHVDGNLARLYQKPNQYGKYLDGSISFVFEQPFFISLGFYHFYLSDSVNGIALSLISVFLITNASWLKQRFIIDSYEIKIKKKSLAAKSKGLNISFFKKMHSLIDKNRTIITFPVLSILFFFEEIYNFLILLAVYDFLLCMPIIVYTFRKAKSELAKKDNLF